MLALAIIIQKADHVPGIWYAWLLDDPHVVPSLLAACFFCFLVWAGQFKQPASIYWRIFSTVIPDGHHEELVRVREESAREHDQARRDEVSKLSAKLDERTLERNAEIDEASRLKAEVARLEAELASQHPVDQDDLKDIDDRLYQHIRAKFLNLPWHQQYALKLIWTRRVVKPSELIQWLQNNNFSDPRESMVRPLLEDTTFIQTNRPHTDVDNQIQSASTEISIKSNDLLRILKKLFKETPLC